MSESANSPYPYLDAVLLDFLPSWIADTTADPRSQLSYHRDLLVTHPDDLAVVSEYDGETPERRLAFVREFEARLPALLSNRSEAEIRGFYGDLAQLRADRWEFIMKCGRKLVVEGMAGPLPPSPESN
jgi:hypothetical protein